jgi:hypothetical protein
MPVSPGTNPCVNVFVIIIQRGRRAAGTGKNQEALLVQVKGRNRLSPKVVHQHGHITFGASEGKDPLFFQKCAKRRSLLGSGSSRMQQERA